MGLRHRRAHEGGFTLAEVMIVVLILGILLSIALPTFLGARNRTNDVVALASLDIATETARFIALADPDSDFTSADVDALETAEPSLTFLPSGQPSTGPNEVSVDASSTERWTATVRSQSGTCFGVEVTTEGSATFLSTSCVADEAADSDAAVNVAPTSAASLSSDWRTEGLGADKLIDGILDNFAHADWQNGQSAAFDLGRVATIEEIRLWNREDCCPRRMRNMWVFVSPDPISADLATARASGAFSVNLVDEIGRPTSVPIGTNGQHVRVFATGPAFHLAEIEIFALP